MPRENKQSNGAPAVHVDRSEGWTKQDIMAMIADTVGPAVIQAMKEAEDAAFEERGQSTRQAFEISPAEIFRAGTPSKERLGDKGMLVAGFMGWIARAEGDAEKAYKLAKRGGAPKAVQRALGESSLSTGGSFVPENVANDFIELLYANTVYLAANPTRVPVPNGNLTLPKLATGATASWVGESENIAKSEQTTGSVRMDLKKLAVLTPFSNELLYDSGPAIDAMIRDDLVASAAVTLDSAYLRGVGSEHSPRGLRNLAHADTTTTANGTVNAANTSKDLAALAQTLEDSKIKFVRPHWFFAPRTRWYLMSLRDGNNNLIFAPEMSQGKLMGWGFGVSQQIPITLDDSDTAGNDETEIYLCDMVHHMVGDDPRGMQVKMADGVAYYDGSAVQAGFSRDESVIRLILRTDLKERQDGKSIGLMKEAVWVA